MPSIKIRVEGTGPSHAYDSPETAIEPVILEGVSGMALVFIPENAETYAEQYPHGGGRIKIFGGMMPLEEVVALEKLEERTLRRVDAYVRAGLGSAIERESLEVWLAERTIIQAIVGSI